MKMASLVILIPARSCWSAPRSRALTAAPAQAGVQQPRRARLQRDPVRASRRPRTTTAAPSPGSRRTRPSTTSRSASRCWSARLLARSSRCWRIAGSLAQKKLVPPSAGTLPTPHAAVRRLLVGTVIVVGALTFIPALALGPIVEHLQTDARGPLTTTTSRVDPLPPRHDRMTQSRRRSSTLARSIRPIVRRAIVDASASSIRATSSATR